MAGSSNKKLYLLLAAFVVVAAVVTVVIAWLGSDPSGLGGGPHDASQTHYIPPHLRKPGELPYSEAMLTTSTTTSTTSTTTTTSTTQAPDEVEGIGVFAGDEHFSLRFPSSSNLRPTAPSSFLQQDLFGVRLQQMRYPDAMLFRERDSGTERLEDDEAEDVMPVWSGAGNGEDPESLSSDWLPSGKLDELEAISYEFRELYELAGRIYNASENITDFHTFVSVLNETVNERDKSGLLSKLNTLYTRPEELGSEAFLPGKSAYETSLAAFAFLSFGIFLMNQMHTLLGRKQHPGHGGSQGRKMDADPVVQALDALFYPPDHFRAGNSSSGGAFEGRSSSGEEESQDNQIDSTGYVNNMFRAFLNLINAYMKDEFVLECIWALYCKDLDNTAAKEGLYGVAARVNSIGLRLIMQQIPTELTMDMLIRSLLGWDGLPCDRMFPRCGPNDADDVLIDAASAEVPLQE